MMNHKNLPNKVRERAYQLVLQYACAADAIAEYNTDNMKDNVPVQSIGHGK